jgi:nucleoside-diphosphate-sugar epimerase
VKKVLVTGSNGFIAQNFIKYTLEQNSQDEFCIFGVSRQSGWSVDSVAQIYHNKDLQRKIGEKTYVDIYTDLTNEPCVKTMMEKIAPDIIFHFASSRKDTIDAYLNNVIGTANLMKYIPEGARIIYASQASSASLCGASHLAGESLIGAQSRIKNLNYMILRSTPGQSVEDIVSAAYTLEFGDAKTTANSDYPR